MRPFKFFFTIALGIVLFLFFARFLFAALILAAVMSGIFFIGSKIRGLMGSPYRTSYAGPFDNQRSYRKPDWMSNSVFDQPYQRRHSANIRVIEVEE